MLEMISRNNLITKRAHPNALDQLSFNGKRILAIIQGELKVIFIGSLPFLFPPVLLLKTFLSTEVIKQSNASSKLNPVLAEV